MGAEMKTLKALQRRGERYIWPADYVSGRAPPASAGWSQDRKRVYVYLELERTHLMATNLTFLLHIFSHIHIHKY